MSHAYYFKYYCPSSYYLRDNIAVEILMTVHCSADIYNDMKLQIFFQKKPKQESSKEFFIC